MTKLWAGRTEAETAQLADDFNSSISFDSRMAKQDITGSMAHAAMLGAKGIITQDEADTLIDGLHTILDDLTSGALHIDPAETLAFGDGLNDISMLRAAGTGIAMGNAAEAVKDAADEVTLDCDRAGVAAAVERFFPKE